MAQHDYVIANGTGAAVRSDLNNALAAIVSQNSGATEPATTYAYQWWADTTTNLLKLRNAANSGWITLFQLDGEWSTIALENGTAGAPSIYFKDSGTDTGFYSPGANQVGISTGGTARLTIDSNGNVDIDSNTLYVDAANNRVGLGTSSPSVNLHTSSSGNTKIRIADTGTAPNSFGQTNGGLELVGGNANTSAKYMPAIKFGSTDSAFTTTTPKFGAAITAEASEAYDADTDGGMSLAFWTTPNDPGTGGSLQQRLTILNSGNVGIGTTSASTLLHCSSGSVDIATFQRSSAGADAAIMLVDSVNTGAYLNTGGGANLIFATRSTGTNSERARIDSSGRLLVGTSSSPTVGDAQYGFLRTQGNTSSSSGFGLLSIARGLAPASITSGAEIGYIHFTANDGSPFARIECSADANAGANDYPGRLVFSTTADGASSPTERMRINAAGGFKASTNGTYANSSAAYHEFYQSNNDQSGLAIRCVGASFSDINLSLAVDRNTTNNTYYFIRASVTGVAYRFNVADSGNCTNTNNSYTGISDIKLKENIVDANSQWSDIKSLQVRNYNFKEETGQPTHRQIGLIAQEVEPICPSLVDESPDIDADGNDPGTVTKSVNYSVLYMKAVKALQEAMERIEALEAKVAALEAS